jgi:hypothetical protein
MEFFSTHSYYYYLFFFLFLSFLLFDSSPLFTYTPLLTSPIPHSSPPFGKTDEGVAFLLSAEDSDEQHKKCYPNRRDNIL